MTIHNVYDVAVIGGGPAGMTAAIRAAESVSRVALLECNDKLGKKLYITGKGRCNVANTADADRLVACIMRGGAFTRSALASFGCADLRGWLDSLGVPTVVERGGRVFPTNMKASDITKALTRELDRLNADIMLSTRVTSIERLPDDNMFCIALQNDNHVKCRAVIVATGGLSYPSTGSTGDGYSLAESIGHSVEHLSPSLVPLTSPDEWVHSLQGITLRNVVLTAKRRGTPGKVIWSEQGEMLFTHFGISGPLALTLSSVVPADSWDSIDVMLDTKPGMSDSEVELRLIREFTRDSRRQAGTLLTGWFPSRLAVAVLELCGIPHTAMVGQIRRDERMALARAIKRLPIHIEGTRGFDEAVVTRGGINLRDIDPKTMQSRLARGLYFAGETLDIDALTGGFNLMIAFATGNKAGLAAGEYINNHLTHMITQ